MDSGSRPLIPFLIAIVLGALIGFYFTRRREKQGAKIITQAEYWVYLPGLEMPEQDAVMTRLITTNPHGKAGQSPIGPKEGLLFSDIRLHVALVLRSKNPHVFRPDLFSETEADAESLAALSAAQSMVKLRYVSEEPLNDDRHMRFLPHLADAYAQVGKGVLIYDAMAEQLIKPNELFEMLSENPTISDPGLHFRVVWKRDGEGAYASTKGLIKKGLPELTSAMARPDNQLLITEVIQAVGEKVWQEGFAEEMRVTCFGDEFIALAQPGKGTPRTLHIQRVRTAG